MAILAPLMAFVLACAPARAADVGREGDGVSAPQLVAAPGVQPLSPNAGLPQTALTAGVSLPASAIPSATPSGPAAHAAAAQPSAAPASAPKAAANVAAGQPAANDNVPTGKAAAAHGAVHAGASGAKAAGALKDSPSLRSGAASAGAAKTSEPAKDAQAHGSDAGAAEAQALGSLFDNSAAQLAAAPDAPAIGDSSSLGHEQLLALAQTLSPLDAPSYYAKAAQAATKLPADQRKAAIGVITRSAEKRAPQAILGLIHDAFEQAKAGAFGKDAQPAFLSALKFWNGALEHAQDAPLKDPAAVAASLQHIQAEAAAGLDALAWTISFTKLLAEKPFKIQVNFVKEHAEPKTAAGPAPALPGLESAVEPPAVPLSFGELYALARQGGRGRVLAYVDAAAAVMTRSLSNGWASAKRSWSSFWVAREPAEDDLGPATIPMVDAKTFEALKQTLGPDEIVLHQPRARVRRYFGYQVRHARLDGLQAEAELDLPVVVKVGHGGTEGQLQALRRRFDTFNKLIETNFAALELIAQNPHSMTVKQARAVAERVIFMAEAYTRLIPPDDHTGAAHTLEVNGIVSQLAKLTAGLGDADPVPAAALKLIVPLEKKSLHRAINQLHQLALERVGRVGEGGSANFFVWLKRGENTKQLALIDLSNDPLVKDGRIVSPGFKALTEALSKAADTPKGSLIMQDHQFWGHFKLGAHSAEIYANFLPPDEGGMIRVRYQEWGTDIYNQARLYYVARTLQFLGFTVASNNGFLTAVVDKDHQSQTADQMRESFSMVVQALHATVGLDFALPMILKGSQTSAESGRRIDEWVRIVLAEGGLPFYENDQHENMVRGYHEYEQRAAERAKLENALEQELLRLGLPEMPLDEALGQRMIDRHFNDAVERALARGEVQTLPDGALQRVRNHDAVRSLAQDLAQDHAGPARMGEAVSSLDPGLFSYETIGSIGALTVQRAQRRLDSDTWLNVYALRDPQTGQIGMARAELGTLTRAPQQIGPSKLFALLAEQGHPVSAFKPADAPAGLGLYLRKLRQAPLASDAPGDAFSGLAASPGAGRPVTARLTFDKKVAAAEPRVFVAPYTDPDDLDAIRNSKAVVTTSGGLLSHAAITTREMGIGAVILNQAEWKNGKLALKVDEFGPPAVVAGLPVRQVKERREVELGEGDVVRVDPASGRVETFPAALQQMIVGISAALDGYDDGRVTGAALAASAQKHLGAGKLAAAQQLALSRELLAALTARAAVRPQAAGDLRLMRRALRAGAPSPLGAYLDRVEADLFNAERSAALPALRDAQDQLIEAVSLPGVERLSANASAQLERLRSLAAAFERPASDLRAVETAYEAFKRASDQRSGALLAADVAELEQHLKLFPSVTVDALPKLKALVAKAKRRKLAPRYYAGWEKQIAALESQRRQKRAAAGPLALKLSEVLDIDVGIVGGKGAKLGEIADIVDRAGGRTAPGIALTVQAYREFIRSAGIQAALEGLAAHRDLPVEERSARIQRLIRGAALTPDSAVGRVILQQLAAAGLRGTYLAVRSSAVDEDGAAAAFAGAGDTHLYVSEDELLDKVKQVWASLYNPRALLYRESKGLTLNNLAQAVVIQAMVPSEVSGVAFTEDPVSGNTGRVVVNAAFGLGEGIVSGRVAPDQYVLAKRSGREILPAMISDKKIAVVRGENGKGSAEQRVAPERRRARALTPADLEKLNTVATALENHFGYALDIEFAFVGDRLYILQARAVTTADVASPPGPAAPVDAAKAAPIIFVCAGNTCRSPMAAAMLRQEFADSGIKDVPVASRGLHAEEGQPIARLSAETLAERGLSADDHRSASLTAEDVASARLLLVMEPAQADALLRKFPQAQGKVHLLTEYAGQAPRPVADPYGGDAAAYEAAAHQIEVAVGGVASRLAGELAPTR